METPRILVDVNGEIILEYNMKSNPKFLGIEKSVKKFFI